MEGVSKKYSDVNSGCGAGWRLPFVLLAQSVPVLSTELVIWTMFVRVTTMLSKDIQDGAFDHIFPCNMKSRLKVALVHKTLLVCSRYCGILGICPATFLLTTNAFVQCTSQYTPLRSDGSEPCSQDYSYITGW
jgi:hypothetical protein